MPADALIGLLPDLVMLMRRDGRVVASGGGHGVPELRPAAADAETAPSRAGPTPRARSLPNSSAVAFRSDRLVEARFHEASRPYDVRATAQGPDRALVVIRRVMVDTSEDTAEHTGERPRPQLDRRGFMRA